MLKNTTFEHIDFDRMVSILGEPRGNPKPTQAFMLWWFKHYTHLRPFRDTSGNFWLVIGDTPPTIMFTAHTDTVDNPRHKRGKPLLWHAESRVLSLDPMSEPFGSRCLGADDGAGCEVLVCLAEAGVPGLYCWFAEEEGGGAGGKAFAETNGKLLSSITHCVSFDRKGTTGIVYEQWMGETGSHQGALELAAAIGMGHTPDNTGTFTDSATFADIIPECLNVSIGYTDCHTPRETLDMGYLDALVGQLKELGWSTLVPHREPGDYGYIEATPKSYTYDITEDISEMIYLYPELVEDFLQQYGLEEEFLRFAAEEGVIFGNSSSRDKGEVPTLWPPDYKDYL